MERYGIMELHVQALKRLGEERSANLLLFRITLKITRCLCDACQAEQEQKQVPL